MQKESVWTLEESCASSSFVLRPPAASSLESLFYIN